MKITLVTPADKGSRSGNRTTADRWAAILRKLHHRVEVVVDYDGAPARLMVAIHAWRSAAQIRLFKETYPDRPLVLCLSGTDIYRFQRSHPQETLRSMELADAIVCLHDLVGRAIPAEFARKLHVIRQSALPVTRVPPVKRNFEICVVGHLRDEKDPLRAAMAVRDVRESSKLKVIQLGKAHDEAWAASAEAESASNPRYEWRGEVPLGQVRKMYARARAMVISSRMEGGANVISEAVVAGLPVIASAIDGNVGLLGIDYPGYFPLEDTVALRDLLLRAEAEPEFLASLKRHGDRLAPGFAPARELAGWRDLIAKFK